MMDLKEQVQAISTDPPAFDLSNDELYEMNLSGIDLSWVASYMYGIDLRGAVLTNLHLGNLDHAEHSYLQCADLQGAILKGADLEYANFRGANLTGAHFEGADLTGADLQGANVTKANFSGAIGLRPKKLKYAFGSAVGLPPGVVPSPIEPPDRSSCLASDNYGNPPKGNPSPTFSPSAAITPTSSPSATASPTSSPSATALPSPVGSP